jgi:hypothetical protein
LLAAAAFAHRDVPETDHSDRVNGRGPNAAKATISKLDLESRQAEAELTSAQKKEQTARAKLLQV